MQTFIYESIELAGPQGPVSIAQWIDQSETEVASRLKVQDLFLNRGLLVTKIGALGIMNPEAKNDAN